MIEGVPGRPLRGREGQGEMMSMEGRGRPWPGGPKEAIEEERGARGDHEPSGQTVGLGMGATQAGWSPPVRVVRHGDGAGVSQGQWAEEEEAGAWCLREAGGGKGAETWLPQVFFGTPGGQKDGLGGVGRGLQTPR